MNIPGLGTVMWHRGKGAKECVDITDLPVRIAMDWSPTSGGKNYAGLPSAPSLRVFIKWYLADRVAAKAPPCLYEVIEDLVATPTRLGVSFSSLVDLPLGLHASLGDLQGTYKDDSGVICNMASKECVF